MAESFRYIETNAETAALAKELRRASVIGIDTEFMREKTYFPRLCLIQLATTEQVACVDPLAVDDLGPLLDVLYDDSITKVLHAAKQDLEILFHLRGALPRPVFDTQIAAAVLGFSDQVGYANLVEGLLGHRLDKAHTRADWAARPLTREQLRYAADDAAYLPALYQHQCEALARRGRRDWLTEDFAALVDSSQYAINPEQVWRRIRDARRLKGRQLAVLQALAAWRERRAMALDRPRKWILRDEVLVAIARAEPRDLPALKRIRGLEPAQLERVGQELMAAVQTAQEIPPGQWPQLEQAPRLSPEQEALADTMMALVRLRAAEHELSPAMLATRKSLERLAAGENDVAVLHGWRAAVAGDALRALLAGTLSLRVVDGWLRTEPD